MSVEREEISEVSVKNLTKDKSDGVPSVKCIMQDRIYAKRGRVKIVAHPFD